MYLVSSRADAVLIPESMKTGAKGQRQINRLDYVLRITEPILGVVRGRGERGFVRRIEQRARDQSWYLLITRSPLDTYLYPKSHPKEGQHRYRWSDDGMIRVGYLIDDSERCIHEYETYHMD